MEETLIIEKIWGRENVLVNEPEYCCKVLNIFKGQRCSLHYHKQKKETFIVRYGRVFFEQRDIRGTPFIETLHKGDSRTIMPGTPHRFSSTGGAILLEVSTHHEDSDVTRLEPSGPCS